MSERPLNIAIFGSGGGSNAQALIDYFRSSPYGQIVLVVSNNPEAKILDRARREGIPEVCLPTPESRAGEAQLKLLDVYEVDLILLAGYLRKVPPAVVQKFHRRILNIHPALLPMFGGKGMHGMIVHEAVVSEKMPISGMTIHYVDDIYDNGETIFQAAINVEKHWQAADLAEAVLKLEHAYYPVIAEKVCMEILAGKEC